MRFPHLHELSLPCVLERFIPGSLHIDGKRYLPLLIFRLSTPSLNVTPIPVTPANLLLGVVDRHHRVAQGMVGSQGSAQLVCALSAIRMQHIPYSQGIVANSEGTDSNHAHVAPVLRGRIKAVLSWEIEAKHLSYESLYTELLVDIGIGVIGVRAGITADNLSDTFGKRQLEVNDWIEMSRSRIDILGFIVTPTTPHSD